MIARKEKKCINECKNISIHVKRKNERTNAKPIQGERRNGKVIMDFANSPNDCRFACSKRSQCYVLAAIHYTMILCMHFSLSYTSRQRPDNGFKINTILFDIKRSRSRDGWNWICSQTTLHANRYCHRNNNDPLNIYYYIVPTYLIWLHCFHDFFCSS